ncbi:hypothetical protein AB0L40_04100 [Patulibacter sp. NPDC049589]|uniref:hypothetical protein n=1 Tax=Patulibacter sp. NPDC049589 TaxID=3154731 RepID=UPI003433174F
MSDPQLDTVLRELGDRGLEAGHAAAIARVRDRLGHDLAALDDSGSAAGVGVRRASGRRPAPTRRRPRLLVAVVATLAATATFTATAAVALTAATGSPVPGFARGDTTNVFPDSGTTRITDVRSADPTGGPAWGVRVGRTADGLVCVGAGQVSADGTFGVRGLDGRFRAIAPFGNDSCGPAPRSGRPLVQLRGFSGPGSRSPTGATSVVFGSGGPGLRSVRIATAGGAPRPVAVGDSGTFVLAVAGLPEGAAPQVRLRWDDGAERNVELGRDSSLPDPGGRLGWSAATAHRGPEGCAVVSILRVQGAGGARVCGPLAGRQATLVPVRAMHGLGPRLALLVRRDDGDRITVAFRGHDVPIVTVRMAGRVRVGTERVLERDRAGRRRIVERAVRFASSGPTASLAVLPAGVRARDLLIRAVRDGTSRTLPVTATRDPRAGGPTTTPYGGR